MTTHIFPSLGLREQAILQSEMKRWHENWKWVLTLGIVLTVLGMLCTVAAAFTTVFTVALLGTLVAVAGVAQIVHAFFFRIGHGFLINLLAGVLYSVVGFLMLA